MLRFLGSVPSHFELIPCLLFFGGNDCPTYTYVYICIYIYIYLYLW